MLWLDHIILRLLKCISNLKKIFKFNSYCNWYSNFIHCRSDVWIHALPNQNWNCDPGLAETLHRFIHFVNNPPYHDEYGLLLGFCSTIRLTEFAFNGGWVAQDARECIYHRDSEQRLVQASWHGHFQYTSCERVHASNQSHTSYMYSHAIRSSQVIQEDFLHHRWDQEFLQRSWICCQQADRLNHAVDLYVLNPITCYAVDEYVYIRWTSVGVHIRQVVIVQ